MKRFFIMLLFLFFFCPTSQAYDLKILSWNTFMLPKPIKLSMQDIRSNKIPQQLKTSDYDVMFFQEAFMPSFRYKLISQLKKAYPFSYSLSRPNILHPSLGSGLLMMSKHPFKLLDKIYFSKCGAYDCYASKGSFLIELTLPSGKKIQLANTHLQAKKALGAIRMQQLLEIHSMLKRHETKDIPQILVGDLNIDIHEPEFREGQIKTSLNSLQLEGSIQYTNARESTCYAKENYSRKKEWVDHFWINQKSFFTETFMQVRVFDFQYNGQECPSSDHHAIEGFFSFNN